MINTLPGDMAILDWTSPTKAWYVSDSAKLYQKELVISWKKQLKYLFVI